MAENIVYEAQKVYEEPHKLMKGFEVFIEGF